MFFHMFPPICQSVHFFSLLVVHTRFHVTSRRSAKESTSHARLVEAEVQRARQKREADEELIGQAPEEASWSSMARVVKMFF